MTTEVLQVIGTVGIILLAGVGGWIIFTEARFRSYGKVMLTWLIIFLLFAVVTRFLVTLDLLSQNEEHTMNGLTSFIPLIALVLHIFVK